MTENGTSPAPAWTCEVRRLVVLSGAGVSTDSGIRDFRGPQGVWTLNPGAARFHTYQRFLTDAELRRGFWESRRTHPMRSAEPNAAHRALAELARSRIHTTVITQNTDGLHRRAQTPEDRLIELHGTMDGVRCVDCGHGATMTDTLIRVDEGDTVPACVPCGGILRPTTTMGGEVVAPAVFARARESVAGCDLLLAVGTTLKVEPAASLCAAAVAAGADLVIVNRDGTPYDGIATEVVRDSLSEAMPRITAQLLAGGPVSRTARPVSVVGGPTFPVLPEPPSSLLRPERAVSRFRFRQLELDRLLSWCRAPGPRIHLLTGDRGVGKSRLAHELAERLRALGDWTVDLPGDPGGGDRAGRHRLLVVDDAEHRRNLLTEVLRSVAVNAEAPPTHVLLLTRCAGEWWERLRIEGAEELLAETDHTVLTPPELEPAESENALLRAARDHASALGPHAADLSEQVPGPISDLDPPWLMEHTALALALGHPQTGTGSVTARLLGHEIAFLRSSAEENGVRLSSDAALQAVATAVLCGADTLPRALAVLRATPALKRESESTLTRTAAWLRVLGGTGTTASDAGETSPFWSFPLPDAFGEHLIASAVKSPGFLLALFETTTDSQERRAVTVLARAASTAPRLADTLSGLVTVLPGLCPVALDVAVRVDRPGPLVDALTTLARESALPADLLAAVPVTSDVLGEFAVALNESLVDAYQERARTRPDLALPGLVRMLSGLTERLTHLGRYGEARACADRMIGVCDLLLE